MLREPLTFTHVFAMTQQICLRVSLFVLCVCLGGIVLSRPVSAATPKPAPASKPVSVSQPATRASVKKKLEPFAVGIQLCRESEWERALGFFQGQKTQALLELSLPDRVRLFAFLGLIYANLLQPLQSRSAFEKALLLDPCARLPALRSIAPQIRADFRKVQAGFVPACDRQRIEEKRLRELLLQQRKMALLRKLPPGGRALLDPVMRPSKAMHLSAWIVTGVGAATLAAACTFGGLALWDDVQRQQTPYTLEGTKEYLRLAQQATDRALTANVFFGVAGALLFTGFALHVSKWIQEHQASPSSAKISPKTEAGRVVMHGAF